MPMINEAFHAWMEGVATPADIDQIMLLGCNFPMGPLRLSDFIGLDVCHDILMVLHRELGDLQF
jgi:3-hydroxybutyryl-CoA dehydrogenase